MRWVGKQFGTAVSDLYGDEICSGCVMVKQGSDSLCVLLNSLDSRCGVHKYAVVCENARVQIPSYVICKQPLSNI